MKTYRLFGMRIASDRRFLCDLPMTAEPADLTFTLCSQEPPPLEVPAGALIYESPYKTLDGSAAAQLFRAPEFEMIRFPGMFDFYLRSDGIVCRLADLRFEAQMELRLTGPVLAYWLEQRGCPALHASAVSMKDGAAAFLAPRGGGKTGLAAASMQAGCSLLTDDMLAIEPRPDGFFTLPAYPQMRMWPDEAEWFLGSLDGLACVDPGLSEKRRVRVGAAGFGTFCARPARLSRIYLPKRSSSPEAGILIQKLTPRDALMELLRDSFTPLLVEAAGLRKLRFELLSRLVLEVPVKRVCYPSGFCRLSEVADAILSDAANSRAIRG